MTQPDSTVVDVQAWLDKPEWMQRARCTGANPDLFFPTRGEDTGRAKAICNGCPVRFDCLDYAMVNGEKHGIWGGLSERERRRLRRRVRVAS